MTAIADILRPIEDAFSEECTGSDFESEVNQKPEGQKYKKLNLEGKLTFLKDLKADLETFFGKRGTGILRSIDEEIEKITRKLNRKIEKKEREAWIRDSLIGTGNSFAEIFETRDETEQSKHLSTKEKIAFYKNKLEQTLEYVESHPDKKNRKKNGKIDRYLQKIQELERQLVTERNGNIASIFRKKYLLNLDNFLPKKSR